MDAVEVFLNALSILCEEHDMSLTSCRFGENWEYEIDGWNVGYGYVIDQQGIVTLREKK